jgi:hypothetical protein
VAAYLVAYNGIVSASNVFVAGNVTSQWFLGKANLSSIISTDLSASGMIYANAGVNSTSTGTGALVVNGGVGITGNLTVGNVTVLGALTTVSSSALNIANSFVFLSNNNITNVLDIGFVGQYAAGQGNVYTGLVRRASDGIFRLFSNLSPIPSTTINVAGLTLATLQLGNILAGNVTGVINVPAQPYITSLGNLANLSSSGNITTTGYFFGNGSQLAGLVSYSNVYVATYLPTYSGNVANLTVTATLAGPTITAINSNVTVGNTNMKNYVDGQITAANGAVTSANLGMVGYVDNSVTTANTAMKNYVDSVADRSIYGNSNVKSYLTNFDGNLISNGNITYNIGTAVNQWASIYANVIYANSNIYIGGTDLKSYIDGVATLSIYSNVNAKAYTESMGFTNFSNVNVAAYVTTANSAIIGYIDQANTIQSAQVNAANLAITAANVGMKGYVDSVATLSSYGNSNVTAYTVTMGFTNFSNVNVSALITTNGLTNYSNVNAKAYTESMGFSNYSNVNVSALITTNGLTNYSNVNVASYLAGNITVGNIAGSVNGYAIGYRDVPQITLANLTLIASDAGKHYYGANTNPTTLTIPLNSSVAFGNGTAISIVNQGTGNITVANAAGVQLYLAGNTTGGSRTITSYGMATLIKVQVNTWFINGTGVV